MRRSILALLFALSAWAPPALAHVAPSPDANNRYVKITLLPDAVRVAYTVFFGDRPGLGQRRRMDADGNGAIDAREAAAFGESMAREIAGAVSVTVDDVAPASWAVADVGLGAASVTAGAFSIDLVLRVPLPDRAEHVLRLVDDLSLPSPGETHVQVDESPGVRLTECHVDDARGLQTRFDFQGNPDPARAIVARFTVDPGARPPRPTPWLAAAAAVVMVALAGLYAWRRSVSGRNRGS